MPEEEVLGGLGTNSCGVEINTEYDELFLRRYTSQEEPSDRPRGMISWLS